MEPKVTYSDGLALPRGHSSLTHGVGRAAPGSVHALALGGGYAVGPRDGRVVYFGRNRPLVHVCVGEDDQQVSRRHGELTHHRGTWWLRNTGRRPIRLPGAQWLFTQQEAIPLAEGYTPLLVPGSRDREHLLEIYVTGPDGDRPRSRHGVDTDPPRRYALTRDEKLVLVVLGGNYLSLAPNPNAADVAGNRAPARRGATRREVDREEGRTPGQRGARPPVPPRGARPDPRGGRRAARQRPERQPAPGTGAVGRPHPEGPGPAGREVSAPAASPRRTRVVGLGFRSL